MFTFVSLLKQTMKIFQNILVLVVVILGNSEKG